MLTAVEAFVAVLREHHSNEDDILFPWVEARQQGLTIRMVHRAIRCGSCVVPRRR